MIEVPFNHHAEGVQDLARERLKHAFDERLQVRRPRTGLLDRVRPSPMIDTSAPLEPGRQPPSGTDRSGYEGSREARDGNRRCQSKHF